jgi:hypothetical protein
VAFFGGWCGKAAAPRKSKLRASKPAHSKEREGAACIILGMKFTPGQAEVLKRLFAAGFRPIAIPPYENLLCVHRGECAALLAPVGNGGLRLMAPVTLLVDGNLSVRLKKPSGDLFVWKKSEVAATEERLQELEKFREELEGMLERVGEA